MRSTVSRGLMILAPCVVLVAFLLLNQETGSTRMNTASSPPQETPSLGKAIFDSKCASCHGAEGKGDGPPSMQLMVKPRDFTAGKYKFRSTESGSIPTDEDLFKSVREGLHGTSMPNWGKFMSDDSVNAVVEYIKSLSPRFKTEKPRVVRLGTPIPSSPASIAAGKKVFEKLQCGQCHGTDGAGTDAVATDLKDDWGNDLEATHLTEPWNFRGGSTARDIYMRFRTGLDGAPMPSYAGTASEQEMWHLANYVVSLARKPMWAMNEQELSAFFTSLDQLAKASPVPRGKYLVESIGCANCHSMYTDEGFVVSGMKYAGGLTFDLYPFGTYTTRNLTSDKETGLGDWSDEEILLVFNEGIRKDGRKLLPFPMPWMGLAQLKDDDKHAIIAYLRTIPPVSHKIPDPETPNIFSYLWGKFRMLVLKESIPGPAYPMKEVQP